MRSSSISLDVLRVQSYHNALSLSEVTKNTQIVACACAFLLIVCSEMLDAGLRTALPNNSITGYKTLEGPGNQCIFIDDSRYLMNAGGFQVGHWGMVASKLGRAILELRYGECLRTSYSGILRWSSPAETTGALLSTHTSTYLWVLSAHTGVELHKAQCIRACELRS